MLGGISSVRARVWVGALESTNCKPRAINVCGKGVCVRAGLGVHVPAGRGRGRGHVCACACRFRYVGVGMCVQAHAGLRLWVCACRCLLSKQRPCMCHHLRSPQRACPIAPSSHFKMLRMLLAQAPWRKCPWGPWTRSSCSNSSSSSHWPLHTARPPHDAFHARRCQAARHKCQRRLVACTSCAAAVATVDAAAAPAVDLAAHSTLCCLARPSLGMCQV